MKSPHRIRIITNNPLVVTVLSDYYTIEYYEGIGYRDILVKARDLVYSGYGDDCGAEWDRVYLL